MIGVVSGQLVNAWREDRRWQREVAREDLRWQRELTKNREQYSHDQQQKTRELQLQTYSEFVATMSKVESNLLANITCQQGKAGELSRLHQENALLIDNVSQLLAKISIISTDEISHAATLYKETVDATSHSLMRMERNATGVTDEDITDRTFRYFNSAQSSFIDAVKTELQVG
ncbi:MULTISPECIES: hypothetical protein [Amycolatopsis]|uniref:Uncharacterized protein n=1 Tax=Amycolatopsis albidoflavus TaxID=102226 RepID=A0ABW5HQK1_9PSEU